MRITFEINQRGACSIRRAKEIDLFVSQRPSHFVQIIHCDGSGVACQIRITLKLLATLAHAVQWKEGAKVALQIGRVIKSAVERMRSSSATLIHKYKITSLPNPGKSSGEFSRTSCCSSAGATRKVNKWIRRAPGSVAGSATIFNAILRPVRRVRS